MRYGLDIGPDAIRAAADAADGTATASAPPVVVPTDEPTLESGVDGSDSEPRPLVECDGATYAVGSAATAVVDGTDATPDALESLFSNGVLAVDGYVEPALEALVDDVLGADELGGSAGTVEPDDGDDRLCYTTPGTLVDAAEPTDAHRETVESILADRGIDATPINRGFAVVYDQLAADNYTGLGICLGAQTTSVALAYYGVPALAFSLAKGSEWIVERAADEVDAERERVSSALEAFVLDPDAATDDLESALARAFDALIGDLVDAIDAEATENDVQRGPAVPMAVAGPGAVEGLEYLLGGRFDAASLPFSVRGVRLADAPSESAVRGALAAAEDDVDAHEDVTWSADGTDDGEPASTNALKASGGRTLTFDEDAFDDSHDAERERTDDAIERLFDRLGERNEEQRDVRSDLESAFDDLEYIEERTATVETVADIDKRLEAFADDLGDLEAESETRASEAAVDDLGADVESLATAFDALEDDVAGLDSDVTAELETLESAFGGEVETLEGDIDALAETSADERDALDDRLGDLASGLGDVADRTESLEDSLAAVRTDLEAIDDADETADLESVRRTIRGLDDALETIDEEVDRLETRVAGLAGRLEEQAVRIDGVADRLAEHATRTEDEIGRLKGELDRIETSSAVNAATVEDELGTVGGEIDDLETDLEKTESRLEMTDDRIETVADELSDVRETGAARADNLETRLERTREAIDDLEATAAESDRVDDLEDELAALDAALVELGDSVVAVSERAADLESRAASAEAVDDLTADLERVDDDVGALTNEVELLADARETVDSVTADVDAVATDLGSLEFRLGALEDALEGEVDDFRTELADETAVIDARFETIDERVSTLDNATVSEADVEALEGELESYETRLDSLASEIDDASDGAESSLTSLEARLDAVAASVVEVSSRNHHGDGADEREAHRSDLAAVRAQSADPDAASSDLQTVVTPVAAGGGGAGVVAGGALVVAGDALIGAVVIGLVLIAVAVTISR